HPQPTTTHQQQKHHTKHHPPNHQQPLFRSGDFINIDYVVNDPKKAVILCHGLNFWYNSSISERLPDFEIT
ncbi:hypothetical protein, partial [Flavobacterium sp. HJSW_4]|uniref:hypothetical protein n=1 Tax=Flavobacterium sp. HJSW_4 TaxID=3344660 RepID=UPI0035F3EA01